MVVPPTGKLCTHRLHFREIHEKCAPATVGKTVTKKNFGSDFNFVVLVNSLGFFKYSYETI